MAPTEWIVWHPVGGEDGPDDGRHIRSYCPKSAAEEWGRQHEWRNCEYTLDSDPETVMVCPADDHSVVYAFEVCAQVTRHYFAQALPLLLPTTEPTP